VNPFDQLLLIEPEMAVMIKQSFGGVKREIVIAAEEIRLGEAGPRPQRSRARLRG
jgi:hypothetical protein